MAPDLVGTEILGYEIKSLLGEGGMASVWRAQHTTLETEVAIKVLDAPLAKDKNLVARFIDEAKIQVRLEHPNVVKIENFSMESLAMVMELVPGSPLDEVIGCEVGPIPFDRAMPMIRQICGAMRAAHEMNIVHRDLKPSNIIKTPEGKIKVMDFGIAKVLGAAGRTRTGTSMGTPDYMAPEQIKGAKDVGPTADIYALGVTFYEMLSGRTPFMMDPEAHSEFEMMEAQVHKKPPDPREFYPGIPQYVVDVLMKALEKRPEDRYQTIAELLAALEKESTDLDADQVDPDLDANMDLSSPPHTPSPPPPDPASAGSTAAQTMIEEPASMAMDAVVNTMVESAAAPVAASGATAAGVAVGAGLPMGAIVGIGVGVLVALGSVGYVVFKDNGQPPPPADAGIEEEEEEEEEVVKKPPCPPPGVVAVDLTPVPRNIYIQARNTNNQGYRAYKKKDYTTAMSLWKTALRLRSSHTIARYNLACAYALTGNKDAALCLLRQIRANINDSRCHKCRKQIKHARTDSDLNGLRSDPAYASKLAAILKE